MTVTKLAPNQGWWYLACKSCHSRTRFQDGQYKCTKSYCNCTQSMNRYHSQCYHPQCHQSMNIHLNIFQNTKCELLTYKFCIMASDGTDQLEFILFDKKAEHLFRKPVDKLIDSCNKGNIPHEIQALVGQKSTFIIKISPLKSAGSPNN